MSTTAAPLWPQPIPILGLTGEYQSGKAQPLDAKVLTSSGWKRMGDIQVGDELIDPSGGTCRVSGVFPQGVKDVFRVKFADGASTECCDEHLWLVQTANHRHREQRGLVLSLKEIRQRSDRRHWIPLTEPVRFEANDPLTVDPYLVGVLLGDGGLTKGVTFSSVDAGIIESVRDVLPDGVQVVKAHGSCNYRLSVATRGGSKVAGCNPLLNDLRDLSMMGKRSYEKSIPEQYTLASIWDRLALLQGLCDTDGSASPGSCDFSTTSEELARQIRELVWSLGGTATCRTRTTRFTHKGRSRTGRLSYRMLLRLPDGMNPFRIGRKSEIYAKGYRTIPARRMISVEPVGRKDCQCIAVDSQAKLYVTDDYIVTHNTWFGISICPDPKRLRVYDFELSAQPYVSLGFDYVNVPAVLTAKFPRGFKPVDVWNWWIDDVSSLEAGRFDAIHVDPVTDIERGLTDWVQSNPQHFGHTSGQYQSMSAIMWGDMKDYWKLILASRIAVKTQTFAFVAHLGDEVKEKKFTGKRTPKGKDTLIELASLYLWLERDKSKSPVPAARVLKSRLSHMTMGPDGPEIRDALPPRLPVATPKALREYLLNPPDFANLKPEEHQVEATLTDDERLRLEVQRAEAERDAELARAGRAGGAEKSSSASASLAPVSFLGRIDTAATDDDLRAIGAEIAAAVKRGEIDAASKAEHQRQYAARQAALKAAMNGHPEKQPQPAVA